MIARLLENGHAIGKVGRMEESELAELFARSADPLSAEIDRILDGLNHFDLRSIARFLQTLQLQYDARTLVLRVYSPLFREIGRRVADGSLDIAQEHALSALIRHHLGGILGEFQVHSALEARPSGDFTVVFATPEGDLHEFGILLSAILARVRGWEVLYLGPNVPSASVAYAANILSAGTIVLGTMANLHSATKIKDYVSDVLLKLKRKTRIFVGGERDPIKNDLGGVDVSYVSDLDSLDRILNSSESPSRV